MTTSERGIELIKTFEGFSASAYKCVPSEEYYTIGYGHYSPSVKASDTISMRDAEKLLKDDLAYYEMQVDVWNEKYHFNTNEYDALVSFAYNIGSISQLTQYGKRTKAEIADAMLLYVHDGAGNTLEGLVRRREAERELFLTPVNVSRETYNENSTISDIVDGILKGEFGNDDARKEAIYDLIQGFVNKRLVN